MDKLALLSRVTFFSTAPVSVLESLALAARTIDVPAGVSVAKKGDPGSTLYIVASGTIRVHDGDHTLAELDMGNAVGEFALLDTEPRSASITAQTDAQLLELDQVDFYRIVEPHPEVLQGIIRHILQRMRQQNMALIKAMQARQEELETQVEERTANLSVSVEEIIAERNRLMELNERKNEIIRIVSHDIRSPVSGIASLAGLIKDDKDIASDTKQVQEYAKLIHSSANSIAKFVNEILDSAKLESGTTELKRDSINLAELLKSQFSTFEPVTITKGVKLHINAPTEQRILGDKTALNQAFSNLIANAIKFTPTGGDVTLGLTSVEQDGHPMASIQVTDTGIGIPADAIPKLFDKFSSIQRAGTKGEKGTGLGMSIAKQIVELHHGQIQVVSKEGKGTTFTILLPISQAA